ncbi:DUF2934 domain-containing protein [Rhizobium sp. YIM 134829]|uniref:DUF2934 domain-containing protein n=1 Tax=Rhizobium sp. YIM 134829 TaxID=3390453 RepID=UPI0039782FAD
MDQDRPQDDNREERIRNRAYELWEKDGGSHGSHERHWQDAERELYGSALADGGAHELDPANTPESDTPEDAEQAEVVRGATQQSARNMQGT